MSQVLNLIPDDGYTERALIKGVPRLHGDVRIKYRPMLHPERYAINGRQQKLSHAESSKLVIEVVCKFVKEWDIKDQSGQTLPLTVDRACKLKPVLLERMYAIVSGWEGGDVDEAATPSQEEADVSLEAILGEVTIGQAREEHDLKNSSTG